MTLRSQNFYFGVLALGFFMVSFSYYYSKQIQFPSESQPQDKSVIYPWMGDPKCQQFPVQFAENKTRPKWALTSFPGSGVTWTRQLIEGVTGIYTGTVYGAEEPPIVTTGYHGNEADLNCDCTILIKDHDGTEVDNLPVYLKGTSNLSMNALRRENYQHRGILLLRNPIDALFSFCHYLLTEQDHSDQIGTVSPTFFKGPAWNSYVNYVTYAWADHAIRWIQNIQNGTVIFYEKLLLEDTEAELNRLLRAINFTDPPVDPDRMRCTLKHKNRLDRKRLKKPTIPLTSKQHAKLKASMERVQESLRQKGWPLLPLHLYSNHTVTGKTQNG